MAARVNVIIGAALSRTFGRAFASVRGQFTALKTTALGAVGVITAALGGLTFAKFFKDATEASKGFEAQMSTIRGLLTLAGQSGDELADSLARVEAKSKELGATTQFSASQAAAGFEVLLRAGVSAENALEVIPTVLSNAAAAGIELDESASRLLATTSNLGLGVTGLQRAADVLNTTAANFDTNFQQANDAITAAGASARQFGFDLEQTSAAIGILANNAFKGAEAGTGLRKLFNELVNQSSSVSKELLAVGVNTRNLGETLEFLTGPSAASQKALFKLTEEARRAALILSGAGGLGEIDRVADSMRSIEGATDTLAKAMTDNLQGALLGLGSAWEALQLEFVNQSFLDDIREGVERLAGRIRDFAGSEELQAIRENVRGAFVGARDAVLEFLDSFDLTRAQQAAGDFATELQSSFNKVKEIVGTTGQIVQTSISGLNVAFQGTRFALNAVVKQFFNLKKAGADIGIETLTQRIREFEEAGKEAPADLIRDLNRLKAVSSAAGDTFDDLDAQGQNAFDALNLALADFNGNFDDLNTRLTEGPKRVQESTDSMAEGVEKAASRLSRALAPLKEEVSTAKAELDRLLSEPGASGEEIAAAINRAAKASKDYDAELERLTIRYSQYQDRAIPALESVKQKTDEVFESNENNATSIEDINEAYKVLKVTSAAQLQDIVDTSRAAFETIRDSGTQTADDIRAAFLGYARAQLDLIETSDQATRQREINALREEAATNGSLDALERLIRSSAKRAGLLEEEAELYGKQRKEVEKTTKAIQDQEKSVDSLRAAIQSLTGSVREFSSGAGGVFEGLRGQIRASAEDAGKTGAALLGATQRMEGLGREMLAGFMERGQAFAGVISGAIQGISSLGENAVNFYRAARGAAVDLTGETNKYLEAAANIGKVMDANRRALSRLDAFSQWARDVNETWRRWNLEMGRSEQLVNEISAAMESGSVSAGLLDRATREADNSLRLLDSQQLSGLRSAIAQARAELQRMEDAARSAEAGVAALEGQLAAARGNEIEAARIQNRQRILELEEQLAHAEANNNTRQANALREQIRLTGELLEIQEEKIREREKEAEQAERERRRAEQDRGRERNNAARPVRQTEDEQGAVSVVEPRFEDALDSRERVSRIYQALRREAEREGFRLIPSSRESGNLRGIF